MATGRRFGSSGRWKSTGESLVEGGQAHVLIVTDQSGEFAGEHVVKILKNTKRTARIDKEIETTRTLHSKGCSVLRVVDDYLTSEPDADRPWYIAPRIEGGSLASALRPGRPFGGSLLTALELFRQIDASVRGIHGHGVAHRDLKPANILLDRGTPILADLGLSLVIGELEGERLTGELERIGSLHYTPPEAYSRRPVDQQQFAFDAYALGKLLYEVLAGQALPAFVAPTDPDFDLARTSSDRAVRSVNRILLRLLHNDPAVRMAALPDINGEISDLIDGLASPKEERVVPQWHSDLLSVGDLLARKAAAPVARTDPNADLRGGLDLLVQEAFGAWDGSAAVEQLEQALGKSRGGVLKVVRSPTSETVRSLLGGISQTTRGLEPLEDNKYPFRPTLEAGGHIEVAPADDNAVSFRHMWLCAVAGSRDSKVAFAVCIIRRELGPRGAVDVLGKHAVVLHDTGDPLRLAQKARQAAAEMLDRFVKEVINEAKRAATL